MVDCNDEKIVRNVGAFRNSRECTERRDAVGAAGYSEADSSFSPLFKRDRSEQSIFKIFKNIQ